MKYIIIRAKDIETDDNELTVCVYVMLDSFTGHLSRTQCQYDFS